MPEHLFTRSVKFCKQLTLEPLARPGAIRFQRAPARILAFNWITCVHTGAQTVENWIDLFEAVIKQNARRASAGFLRWSGSIRN